MRESWRLSVTQNRTRLYRLRHNYCCRDSSRGRGSSSPCHDLNSIWVLLWNFALDFERLITYLDVSTYIIESVFRFRPASQAVLSKMRFRKKMLPYLGTTKYTINRPITLIRRISLISGYKTSKKDSNTIPQRDSSRSTTSWSGARWWRGSQGCSGTDYCACPSVRHWILDSSVKDLHGELEFYSWQVTLISLTSPNCTLLLTW